MREGSTNQENSGRGGLKSSSPRGAWFRRHRMAAGNEYPAVFTCVRVIGILIFRVQRRRVTVFLPLPSLRIVLAVAAASNGASVSLRANTASKRAGARPSAASLSRDVDRADRSVPCPGPDQIRSESHMSQITPSVPCRSSRNVPVTQPRSPPPRRAGAAHLTRGSWSRWRVGLPAVRAYLLMLYGRVRTIHVRVDRLSF
jgi:hypothetical protein